MTTVFESKDDRIVYGEAIERFVCNKIISVHDPIYSAIPVDQYKGYKRSPEDNHKDGDIYVFKNSLCYKIDVKQSTINLEDDNKHFDTLTFFEGVTHDYFIGVKGFNGNENDVNQRVTFMLLPTKLFKEKIKDADFMKTYRMPKSGTRPDHPDYVWINSFAGYPGYFSSTDIKQILQRIV